jgi:hypothetical protein
MDESKVKSCDDMCKELADMYKLPEWKKFVMNPYGVVFNMCQIMDETYYDYVEGIEWMNKNPELIIGSIKSALWANVKLEIIKRSISPEKMNENYVDTANGCDELLSRKAWEFIKELALPS